MLEITQLKRLPDTMRESDYSITNYKKKHFLYDLKQNRSLENASDLS